MANFKTPGVYIEEISTVPPSVAQIASAIPAFIGYTKKASRNKPGDLKNTPIRITSMLEYERLFGGPEKIPIKVILGEDEEPLDIQPGPAKFRMYHSLQLFFRNGGGICYIISVGNYEVVTIESIALGAGGGLRLLENEDEPTLIVFPDAPGNITEAQLGQLYQEGLAQCALLQDRFLILETGSPVYEDLSLGLGTWRGHLGTENLMYGAAYYPWLHTLIPYPYEDVNVTLDRQGDTLPFANLGEVSADHSLRAKIESEIAKLSLILPSSGAIAGVYATADRNRGVWKAPANIGISNVIGPAVRLNDQQQELMNVDPETGKSINAIRSFAGKGTLVWGARTLAGNSNEWRYISVRRFFNMVEESLRKSTSWAIFESNDANTWARIKSQIRNYLTNLWRDGALSGATPDDAFFVKAALGSTMTTEDILEGRMNIEIGLAVVRPAEFVVLKFSHKMQEV